MKKAAAAIRGAGRGVKGAAHVLRIDMSVLEHGLRAADLRLDGWLGEAQVAAMIRQAYDPKTELDANSPGATLVSAGPVALSEHWSFLHHDSGYSTVLWISQWPRIEVAPHFLHALIFAPIFASRCAFSPGPWARPKLCERCARRRPKRSPTPGTRPRSVKCRTSPTSRSTTIC